MSLSLANKTANITSQQSQSHVSSIPVTHAGNSDSNNPASSTAPARISFTSSKLAYPLAKNASPSKMNHLLQVARRTGKSAVGFKIQLVVHRMSAQLSNFSGAELVAVMTRHKKKAVTKNAPYQTASKEVVWGDILPFSCTLYMAKTGLFQSKPFQIQVYDTRNDQHVATFEFDLAELVQCDKDAGKETITVATSKCQDPRASLAITVISSRVHLGGRTGGHGDHENSDMSFDDSRSELSVCTIDSRTSAASSHHSHSPSKQSPNATTRHTHESPPKSHGLRNAFPAVHEDEVMGHEYDESAGMKDGADTSSSLDASKLQSSKHQELVRTIEDLESQLRQSESANVQLEKASDAKDVRIEHLEAETVALDGTVKRLTRELAAAKASQPHGQREVDDDSDDVGAMQVDFMQYMSLKEAHDKLARELQTLQTSKAASSMAVSTDDNAAEGNDVNDNNSDSDASSVNEYQDAQEPPRLLAEISELKHAVAAVSNDRDVLSRTIATLRTDNAQLLAQVHDLERQVRDLVCDVEAKDKALAVATAAASLAAENDVDGESDRYEVQLSEAKSENERLAQQLQQLDSVVTQLQGEKSSLLGQLEHAQSANERARSDIHGAQATIAQLSSEREHLTDQLQSAEDAHARATHELASAEVTITELREQVHELSMQLDATQRDLHTLQHEELAASVAATAAAVAKTQSLQERWDELHEQNTQLQTRVSELETQLAELEAAGEARASELQREVLDLQHETTTLRAELEQLRENKQQAEDELLLHTAGLKEALERQRALTVDHEQELTQLGMNNEELRADVERKTEAVQVLSAEWRAKVDTLEQENDYFQRELIDSKMKLAELTQQHDELESANKKMEKAIVEMKIHAAEKELKLKEGGKKK